ncbi:Protein of unknown function [Bacillus cytotoxicus]|nr:Protein of unknown function [Bacillus cytotoxicus]
MSNLENFHFY